MFTYHIFSVRPTPVQSLLAHAFNLDMFWKEKQLWSSIHLYWRPTYDSVWCFPTST